MPLRLTGSYLKRFASERLRRNCQLQQDIYLLLGATDVRSLLIPSGRGGVIDALTQKMYEAISAGKRILGDTDDTKSSLPPYDLFCIYLYSAVAMSCYEALHEYLIDSDNIRIPEAGQNAVPAPRTARDDKEIIKGLLKQANEIADVEVPYIIGSSPDTSGIGLYELLSTLGR